MPWVGTLFHPVTGKPIIQDGIVLPNEVAIYWKVNGGGEDNYQPVVINHPAFKEWWEAAVAEHRRIDDDDFFDLFYGIDAGAMGEWDNFISFELDEVEPEVRHIVVCVLDPNNEP